VVQHVRGAAKIQNVRAWSFARRKFLTRLTGWPTVNRFALRTAISLIMPATFDEFFDCLAASGIMSRDQAERAVAELPADRRPADPKGLATLWAKTGKLTRYQALCLLQGKPKYLAFGEYLILDKLGQGGMGQVLKAEHRRMKRIVALKLITGDSLKNPDSLQRFHREVQAAARLIHPNIVTAFDANEHAGMHYYVMEFVDGTDLGALVKANGPLPIDRAIDFIAQAARGLAYAHSKGIVHRDIKPSNLLLDQEGTIKLLDLGLARTEHDDTHELTIAGQVLGTVDYIAPEQAVNTHTADARSDIYSLGCTLYRLLTGEPIYSGDTMMQKLLAHRDAPIPSLREKRPNVPPAVDAIFQRMVAKRPQDRPQSMAEVATQLDGLELSADSTPYLPKPTNIQDDKLSEFLSGISERDSSGSLAGRPTGSSAAIAVAAKPKVAAKPAAEATPTTNSGSNLDTFITQQTAVMQPKSTLVSRAKGTPQRRVPPLLVACGVCGLLIGIVGTAIAISRGGSAPKPAPKIAPAVTAKKKFPDKAEVVAANAARRKAKSLDRRAAEWAIELGGSIALKDVEGTIETASALPATDFKVSRLAILNKPDAVTDDDVPLLWGLGELVDLNLGGSAQKVNEDRLVATIAALPKLRSINLNRSQMSDAGLEKLKGKAQTLRNVNLRRTQVTEAGVAALQKSRPDCQIQWDGTPLPAKVKQKK
jgi:serine/threonine protein kinase